MFTFLKTHMNILNDVKRKVSDTNEKRMKYFETERNATFYFKK